MRKWRLFGLALGLVAVLVCGRFVEAGKRPAKPDEPKEKPNQAPGKSKRAQEFLEAFDKGNAKDVAGFWTPDGDYVDQLGRKYKGRAAIQKLYERIFAARKGAKLTIHVTSARMVGTDVALEEGVTEVSSPDGGPPTVGAFSAVLVKKDGEWYFESVRESIAQPPSNAEHFDDLEWVLGDWKSDPEKGESAKASYEWAENKNFIVSTFSTSLDGHPVVGGTQWIAWDADKKQIRSWSFYSGGGFGEAVWTKDGESWLIKVSARTRDGKKVSATNILTRVDDNTATWQVTKLNVDGKSMPDHEPQKLKRVKED